MELDHVGWIAVKDVAVRQGLRGIANELEVKPAGARSDTEIAEASDYALRWNVDVEVALAQVAASIVTRSTALAAQAAHALADTGNELLQIVAQLRSARRPDARHPVGARA